MNEEELDEEPQEPEEPVEDDDEPEEEPEEEEEEEEEEEIKQTPKAKNRGRPKVTSSQNIIIKIFHVIFLKRVLKQPYITVTKFFMSYQG